MLKKTKAEIEKVGFFFKAVVGSKGSVVCDL